MARWSRCTSRKASRSAGSETWEAEGLYRAGAGKRRDETFVICVPPPNVTGALHMGHALNGSLQDVAHPLAPDARLRHALAAGLRPRRHRDAERRREATRAGGDVAEGARPRRVRRARLAPPRGDGPHDHGPVPQPRRLARLQPRALHDGRRLRRGRDALLRPSLGARLDLPGRADRQLVPVPRDRDLRPRGRARRHGRHAHLRPLPVRRRLRARHDRDRAAGDDARRRRRRRAPRRRAVPRRDRQGGARPLRRAGGAGDRGRARRAGVRYRRAQGDARPRPDGFRDRPRPRAPRS